MPLYCNDNIFIYTYTYKDIYIFKRCKNISKSPFFSFRGGGGAFQIKLTILRQEADRV